MVGRRSTSGNCYCAKLDGLVAELFCDTPHLFFRLPSLLFSCPQSRMGGHNSILVWSARSSALPRHTGLSRFKSVVACKLQHEETIKKRVQRSVLFIV